MLARGISRVVLVVAVLATVAIAPGAQDAPEKEPDGAGLVVAQPLAGRLAPERKYSVKATQAGENWWQPDVAYNGRHDTYLMVAHNDWADGRAVYASLINRRGFQEIVSYISTYINKDSVQPAVAYNHAEDEWLVVWAFNNNGDGGTYEIWGVILNADLSIRTDDFHIFSWPNRSLYAPRVAWNSYRNEYLVIWNSFNTSGGLPGVPNDIAAARVSADGVVQAAPLILTTSTYPHQADLVYNVAKDEYFVAFVRSYSETSTGNDIYGLRVNWSGSVINPPGAIPIASVAKNQNAPAVATNSQHRYVVVWEHEYDSSDRDIALAELDTTGTPTRANFFVANSFDDERAPDVAARWGNDVDYVIAWGRETDAGTNIEAWRWDQGVGTAWLEIAAAAFWEHQAPALVWGAPGTLIAYEGDAIGDPTVKRHIYGRLWYPYAVFLPGILRNR